jgi:hypothetical protein
LDPKADERPDDTLAIEQDWRLWLTTLFNKYVASGFSQRHTEFWDWVWSLEPGARPRPFIAIWPRGGAKSTSAELATVAIGARRIRPYGLYICETQEQADDHVGNIGALLESKGFERYYPDMASRAVGKYGNAKGWRRNRLRTAGRFTIDALGLDTAARGVKLEEHRPGWIIVDDVDGELDSALIVEKKIKTLTKKILPAGAVNVAVLAVQNLVHRDSIFSRFADGRADFLADRIVSGPHPAVRNLTYERREDRYLITGGEATWAGQDLQRCQDMIFEMGMTAFLSECQQKVDQPPEGLVYGEFNDDNIVDWEPDPDLPIELACDDGYNDPRVFLFVQRKAAHILVFDEMYHTKHLAEKCVGEAVVKCGELYGWQDQDHKRPKRLAELAVGPPESKELQGRFRLADIAYRFDGHRIQEGIEVVRRLICNGQGHRTLKVHHRCQRLIWEMTQGYIYPPDGTKNVDKNPVDKDNHGPDAFRYWAWLRVGARK